MKTKTFSIVKNKTNGVMPDMNIKECDTVD